MILTNTNQIAVSGFCYDNRKEGGPEFKTNSKSFDKICKFNIKRSRKKENSSFFSLLRYCAQRTEV